MRNFSAILPGARVRTDDGFLGTVERLEHHWAETGDQPDRMVVRSEDGRWRYSIPLMFVHSVSQGAFQPVIYIAMHPDELVHYIYEAIPPPARTSPSRPAAPTDTAAPAPASGDTALNVPVYEEELVVRKHPIVLGKIRVHKAVEHEERHVSLPVYHEETIIDRVPPDQFDPTQARKDPNEVYIPVVEERLVIQKQMVVKEYLRIRKQLVPEQQDVHETVRHERVQLTEERQPSTPAHVRLIRSAPPDMFDMDVADQPTITNLNVDDLRDFSPDSPQ